MCDSKVCTKCGIEKPLTEFTKKKEGLCGHRSRCKVCSKQELQDYYALNKEKVLQTQANWKARNPFKIRFLNKRSHALRQGLEFDLELEDFPDIPALCPVLGLPLTHETGTKSPKPYSPSLDRIDPAKGYVKGNVQWMSHKANAMKQDATPDELLMFADWVYCTYGHLRGVASRTL